MIGRRGNMGMIAAMALLAGGAMSRQIERSLQEVEPKPKPPPPPEPEPVQLEYQQEQRHAGDRERARRRKQLQKALEREAKRRGIT